MEFKINTPANTEDELVDSSTGTTADSTFHISARPVVAMGEPEPADSESLQLPRSYGTETLSLLARDPHTVFAFWDIDWNAAFRDLAPKERKVHLRLLNADGIEEDVVEVEPMAGSSYVTVEKADASYSGEIGFYHPAAEWNCLASSALVATPPDAYGDDEEVDFATVPFHLGFQRMIDLLQETKQENVTLTALLADLRERVASAETRAGLSPEQSELARIVETLRASTPVPNESRTPDPRLHRKLERVLGFGSSSPTGGFGGSSRGA